MITYNKKQRDVCYPKTAIVIISYNNAELTKECIKSIRENNPAEIYQLVVVDNASTDGIAEWLREQSDITLIENTENKGFPYACNQGIAAADKEADIFLLNNDTIVPKNALHWLRKGLYSGEKVGAVGSVSNNVVNYQQVPEQFDTIEEWMTFAEKNNVEMEYPYEKKGWLVGFAMLIKRTAINTILIAERKDKDTLPEVLDNRFSPGNYEDNDLSIRLLKNGYELLLCKNSFIFHHGGKSFGKQQEKYRKLLLENQSKLADKYGIDYIPYSYVESALVNMVKPQQEDFSVLEVGCKLGATLARIQSKYPKSSVCGIEKNEKIAELAQHIVEVECVDFLETEVSSTDYDYVILDGVLNRKNKAGEMLKKASQCAKQRGKLLLTVDNQQCIKGLEDGFTLDEIVALFNECGIALKEFHYRAAVLNKEEKRQLEELMENKNPAERPLYEAERFVFAAERQ